MAVDREPVSVLVPTTRWTPACEDLVEGLREGDELFVICDARSDPVADRETPAGVEVLVAGEPVGCSGKANAMAHGMERAENDRFVWTDADFRRDADWLDRLATAGETHGPATAIPYFYGDGWWRPVEAWTVAFATLPFYLGVGNWGGNAWGGGVTFTREDLDVAELTDGLRTVLSDDGLLSQHLGETHPVRSMVTPVEVSGALGDVADRTIRFNRLTHVHEGHYGAVATGLALVAAAVVATLPTALGATALLAGIYCLLGIERRTFLFAVLGIVAVPFGAAAGIVCKEFEWAGRRYRVEGERDVEVVAGRGGAEQTDTR
jgi:hypothetical protein